MNKGNFYITTAISYPNAAPHLGHAYEAIAADTMARFKRLDGYDVYFMTGLDEHGQKVEKAAKASGKTPQQFVDSLVPDFKDDMCDRLNISYDRFIRTTDKDHIKTAQAVWKKLEANGDIYLDKYAGWYSTRDEAFYTEDDIETRVDGTKISKETKTEVEWMEEESYFFRLSNYTDKLLKLYEEKPEFIQPDYRRNEIVSFVRQGLKDISVSRTSFDWGIDVPGNENHIMYVWIDALANYLTPFDYPEDGNGKLKKFWPCNIHLIGKDIIRFHAVFWPAFLMSAGVEVPRQIFGHGFLLSNGEKMSKSLGNVIAPKDLITKYGVEQTRYVLLREATFGQDVDLSYQGMTARINADLANNLGNLAQRTLSMINKNCEGRLPDTKNIQDVDKELLRKVHEEILPSIRSDFERLQFSRAQEKIMAVARDANSYIDEQAPWTLKKTDPERMNTVLYVLAEVIRCLGIIMQPFTPEACAKLLSQMNVAEDERDFSFIDASHSLKAGTDIPKPEGVFPRIEEEKV